MSTSTCTLQTNGLTERFNQTLSRCLAKVIDDDQLNWDLKIDTILMGYRASRQASTKQSPYYMLYQQHMRLPIDAEMLVTPEQDDEVDHEEVVSRLLQSREKAFKKAEANIAKAQQHQKETYDRKHLQSELPEGSEVLVENTAQKQRKGGKLDDLWLGPYTVHRHMGKGIYQLANGQGKILKKKVNINRLKPFKRRLSSECSPDSVGEPPQKKPAKAKDPDVTGCGDESDEDALPGVTKIDMARISNGQWLNDVVVHAAQQLIKNDKDLLPVGGLQNPLLGQNLSFDVQTGEFVQILHSGGNHWITISTVGMECGHVRVYDSLRGVLPDDAKKQIASLMMVREKDIVIEYANTQVSEYD